MNKRIATTVGAALVGGAVIAGAVPALAAVTSNSPPIGMYVHLNSPDKISAKGAAVTITIVAKCSAGSVANLSVGVTQRSGKGIANGWGQTGVPCTGTKQTVSLYLQANVKPFVVGPASVSTDFYSCDVNYTCNELQAFGTVQFAK